MSVSKPMDIFSSPPPKKKKKTYDFTKAFQNHWEIQPLQIENQSVVNQHQLLWAPSRTNNMETKTSCHAQGLKNQEFWWNYSSCRVKHPTPCIYIIHIETSIIYLSWMCFCGKHNSEFPPKYSYQFHLLCFFRCFSCSKTSQDLLWYLRNFRFISFWQSENSPKNFRRVPHVASDHHTLGSN